MYCIYGSVWAIPTCRVYRLYDIKVCMSCAGSPSITSLLFNRNSTTLTCESTGGPPTTINWKKDGIAVNLSTYEQSQRLVNAESATYENTLFSDDVANFVGTFTCEVRNAGGAVEETVELRGASVAHDQFVVCHSATIKCFSHIPAIRIEWLNEETGALLASATSTQQLDLEFSLVNDSIHGQEFVCQVTRDGGTIKRDSFTVNVDGNFYQI